MGDVTIHYEAEFVNDSNLPGSLYSLRHWLGMFLAEKIFEGPVSLHGELHDHRGGYANTSMDFVRELHGALLAPGAYESNMNSMTHGFVWHLLSLTLESEPTLEEFPSDLARKWCTDDEVSWERFQGADRTDFPRPDSDISTMQNYFKWTCLHAFGHGVYYVLALKELQMKASACNPLFPPGYSMPKETVAVAERICDSADPHVMVGLRHSVSLR